MANSDLKGSKFNVSDEVINKLKSALAKYQSGGDTKGLKRATGITDSKNMSYEHIKRLKNYFDKYEGDGMDDEYKLNGGEEMKQWVDTTLDNSRDELHNIKKTRMDAGEENQFKKTHEKDKDNADPTRVRMPKMHKGSQMRNLMTNKVAYESYEIEIDSIRYLIEYMDNNKNIID